MQCNAQEHAGSLDSLETTGPILWTGVWTGHLSKRSPSIFNRNTWQPRNFELTSRTLRHRRTDQLSPDWKSVNLEGYCVEVLGQTDPLTKGRPGVWKINLVPAVKGKMRTQELRTSRKATWAIKSAVFEANCRQMLGICKTGTAKELKTVLVHRFSDRELKAIKGAAGMRIAKEALTGDDGGPGDYTGTLKNAFKVGLGCVEGAAKHGNHGCLEVLAKKGFTLFSGQTPDFNPVHLATKAGSMECLQILQKGKAEAASRNTHLTLFRGHGLLMLPRERRKRRRLGIHDSNVKPQLSKAIQEATASTATAENSGGGGGGSGGSILL